MICVGNIKKNFMGTEHSPSPDSSPSGRVTCTTPHTPPLVALGHSNVQHSEIHSDAAGPSG